ncbi:hypothetical protein RQM65_09960 [Pricia sp. S334]|uniref:Uncharacterized protein n=1 Tax=Pricia mediterranea TaxID=3076079 RepID=A0ABU3L5G8_9FLAO|nr:hypothetical protein [Pricia sp. S334]MDT7828986.1 hypothetical protein [Pricia sp. S334]
MFFKPFISNASDPLLWLFAAIFFLGAESTPLRAQASLSNAGDGLSQATNSQDSRFLEKVPINLVVARVKEIPTDATNFAIPRKPLHLKPEYPVARQIVENYYNSINKNPGGDCLVVSKSRFAKAYEDVYGRPFYKDLPDAIATKQLTPHQVFNNLFITATKSDAEWRDLPFEYRAKGNAGAVAIAGLGELVDTEGIWSGKLRPGALVQVWRLREDYEKVRHGAEVLDFDPYGHSFIFLGYELDKKGAIKGLRIADQGYQSYRPLVPRDYEVWWGVNLKI